MNLPTTEPAKRIAMLFNRRLTTPWSSKEIAAYKQLVIDRLFLSLTDLDMIERYYAFERRKGEKGIQRRDLSTFLNNYRSETDRAREWNARLKNRHVVFKSKETNGEKPLTETEFISAGKKGLEVLAEWKKSVQPRVKES